jgi:hypothetical protein
LRTLIFTPDASKAMALALMHTAKLGICDGNRLTYKEFIGEGGSSWEEL